MFDNITLTWLDNISVTWLDVIDIILVTVVLYRVLLMIKGTRMASALAGFLAVGGTYIVASHFGLYTLSWILEGFFSSLFLVIVILFREEIRQALSHMGLGKLFQRKRKADAVLVDGLVWVCNYFARRRIGALIVLEGYVHLNDLMHGGVRLDARFSRELLLTIFFPNTALHDGAVILRQGRIAAAGCILPLADLDRQEFGTRHRAAIGITEVSDAVVLVVSEERGEVSVAVRGKLYKPSPEEPLKEMLIHALKLY